MAKKTVLAVCAHPDDIEFMMAGTLLQLGKAGYDLHIMNVANGCCGSMTLNPVDTASVRLEEARAAAKIMGAVHHPPLVNDLEVMYTPEMIQPIAAVVREVNPDIVMTHPLADYMEDHMITARLTVSAAFVRAMPNYTSQPERPPVDKAMTLYHALPYGLCDGMRNKAVAHQYVDIRDVLDTKKAALAAHTSQREWLDKTQGLGSYVETMVAMSKTVGEWSGVFTYAEGWCRHSHLGFSDEHADPLADALGDEHVLAS